MTIIIRPKKEKALKIKILPKVVPAPVEKIEAVPEREKLTVDFSEGGATHALILGPTRFGKTTMIVNFLLKLHETKHYAIIYIDPKSKDCRHLLDVIDLKTVNYLDPAVGAFSLNPLRLPKYPKNERDRYISLYSSKLLSLIDQWFSYGKREPFSKQAPRSVSLLETDLRACYIKSDSPTFADLFWLANYLRTSSRANIEKLASVIGENAEELATVVAGISRFERAAFDPILHRLGRFYYDPILRKTFCSEKPSFDIFEALRPGSFTILSAGEQTVGEKSADLIMSAFIISIYFAAMLKTELGEEQCPIILAIDEFSRACSLIGMENLLSMAAAFGVHVIMCHQTLTQIQDFSLVQNVLTNADIHIVGRLGGEADAKLIVDFWNPQNKYELYGKISSLPRYKFLVRDASDPEAGPVISKIKSSDWVPPVNTPAEVAKFLASQRLKVSPPAPILFENILMPHEKWQSRLPIHFFSRVEWAMLQAFYSKAWSKPNLYQHLSAYPAAEITHAWNSLMGGGYIGIKKTAGVSTIYRLLKHGVAVVAASRDFATIGGTDAVDLAERYKYRVESSGSGNLISVSKQQHRIGISPDLVEFDYSSAKAYAIEIETHNELQTHPDQVKKNAGEKNFNLGFDGVKVVVDVKDVELAKKVLGEPGENVEIVGV